MTSGRGRFMLLGNLAAMSRPPNRIMVATVLVGKCSLRIGGTGQNQLKTVPRGYIISATLLHNATQTPQRAPGGE